MTDFDTAHHPPHTSYEFAVGTDVRLEPPPESMPGVEYVRDHGGELFAATWNNGHDRVVQMPSVATFSCTRGGRRVTAVAEPDASEAEVAEAFHKSVVPLLLYFEGHEVLHASAVRGPKGVVGFCAEAGAGKSTLAYGLGTRGFTLWADDALAFDVCRTPRALLLPFDPKLRPPTLRFFETSSFRPVPQAKGEPAPIAGLAVAKRIPDGKKVVRIERLRGARAFDQVVRHAYRVGLSTDYARRQTLVENYMNIVASVPVFEIAFQPGFERFAAVLDVVAEWLDAEFAQAA